MAQNGEGKEAGWLQKIIVAVVIALLVGSSSPWWWNAIVAPRLGGTPQVPTSAIPVTTTPLPPVTPVQGGKIQVRCTKNPIHPIPAGGQVEISILAFTEQGSPVSGANVRIESGGGWFSRSGGTTEIGLTDSGGVFITQWTAPSPAASGYYMDVYVTKNGLTEGTCQLLISIQ